MKFTTLPFAQGVMKRLLRLEMDDIRGSASKSWVIHPEETSISPPAIFLDGQIERITAWPYQDVHPSISMRGGLRIVHQATRAYEIEDATLAQGRLAKSWSMRRFYGAQKFMPIVRVTDEVDVGALYCSQVGIGYFAHWLMDDCLTYLLAKEYGRPIATDKGVWGHTRDYEQLLGMDPGRFSAVHIKKAVVFEDIGQNASKKSRGERVRRKLLEGRPAASHPGVFIVRGSSGQRRVLRNELEIAERLRRQRGLRIVSPETMSVAEIVEACAGSNLVVGVEGSQLIHGMAVLETGGQLLTLQPPNRFNDAYKQLTDRDGQYFGFVVGTQAGEDFVIDPDEIERTIDLFPQTVKRMAL